MTLDDYDHCERMAFRKQRKESKKGRLFKNYRYGPESDYIRGNFYRKRARDMGWIDK